MPRHSDLIRELGQRHPPIMVQVVELALIAVSDRPFEVFAHERTCREDTGEQVVKSTATLNFTSWNRIGEWLRRLDALRRVV